MQKKFSLLAISFLFQYSLYCQDNQLDPIKTIVIQKTVKSTDSTTWSLYGDPATQIKSGVVLVGDSVEVIGWAPWAFYIRTKELTGYISWKALKVTDELEALSKIIAEQSATEFEKITKKPRVIVKPNAFLSVTSNKGNVFPGECVMITMAFNVHPQNAVPLKFYDLDKQFFSEILPNKLTPDNCFIVNSGINDIVGEEKIINDIKYTTYHIHQASYCPVDVKTITIPAIDLRLFYVRSSTEEPDSAITFTSRPLSIKVNPLPVGVPIARHNDIPLVGKFVLIDSLRAKSIRAGEWVNYQVTITGEGLTYHINAPEIKMPNLTAQLLNVVDSDFISNDKLTCSKTFIYQLIFEKPGTYDLKSGVSIPYYDLKLNKSKILHSTRSVTVLNGPGQNSSNAISNFGMRDSFIAIDVSQSMGVEDYKPNRLGAVKRGLKEFLDSKNCDTGLILFGGDATHYPLYPESNCDANKLVDSIDFETVKKGTAIGAAIFLARNSYAKSANPKKLVIIGDGDNNAGLIPLSLAATLAKRNNVTIYTIGVGTPGAVVYGVDESGNPRTYEKTFTDNDFKTIASITNGKYYWAKDAKDITRILKMIFQ